MHYAGDFMCSLSVSSVKLRTSLAAYSPLRVMSVFIYLKYPLVEEIKRHLTVVKSATSGHRGANLAMDTTRFADQSFLFTFQWHVLCFWCLCVCLMGVCVFYIGQSCFMWGAFVFTPTLTLDVITSRHSLRWGGLAT